MIKDPGYSNFDQLCLLILWLKMAYKTFPVPSYALEEKTQGSFPLQSPA